LKLCEALKRAIACLVTAWQSEMKAIRHTEHEEHTSKSVGTVAERAEAHDMLNDTSFVYSDEYRSLKQEV
jgi:hypothetical protein